MARVGLADDIGRQGTDGGNGDLVGGLGGELGHGSTERGGGMGTSEKCSYIPGGGLLRLTDI